MRLTKYSIIIAVAMAVSALSPARAQEAASSNTPAAAVIPTVPAGSVPPAEPVVTATPTAPVASPVQAAPVQAAPVQAAPVQASSVFILEGTSMELILEEEVWSKTAKVGDRFRISLAAPIRVGSVVIPPGYSGIGEVVDVSKSGFVGKSGNLSVQIKYLVIGDVRVPVRSTISGAGKGNVGASVAVALVISPLGLLIKGKNVKLEKGRRFEVFVDYRTEIPLPLPAPPAT